MGKYDRNDWKVNHTVDRGVLTNDETIEVENTKTGQKEEVTISRSGDWWGDHRYDRIGRKIEEGDFNE
jgi:hypothetical protein